MKTYEVTCPLCDETFDAEIPEEALLPDADYFSVSCPECAEEWDIVYDEIADTVSLEEQPGIDDDQDDDEDEE